MVNKMNILIITGSLYGGGTEKISVNLANFLYNAGFIVNVAVLKKNKITYDINKNISIYELPSHKGNDVKSLFNEIYYSYLDYLSLKKIIKKNNIENVISFCTLPSILFLLLTTKIKIISSKRNYPPKSSFIKTFIEKQIFNCSKYIVFQTSEQMNFYSINIIKKGVIIPNPISSNLPKPYNGSRKKEIITFCRINKQKNLFMLIDGFINFYFANPEYKLTIYGNYSHKDNPYKNQLDEYIIKTKMENIITLKDFNNNIHNIVIDCACFVLTSDYEGLSNSMLEAMAIGLPVICTDCKGGGAREYIDNYINGILIPINDRRELVKALNFIIANPEKAQKMGEKATEINELLSNDLIFSKWINLLNEPFPKLG